MRFLAALPSKRAHLGSDAGIFLRKHGLLAAEQTVKAWVYKRKFLFCIVDSHYVEMVSPTPQESGEAFLDKVGQLMDCCRQ